MLPSGTTRGTGRLASANLHSRRLGGEWYRTEFWAFPSQKRAGFPTLQEWACIQGVLPANPYRPFAKMPKDFKALCWNEEATAAATERLKGPNTSLTYPPRHHGLVGSLLNSPATTKQAAAACVRHGGCALGRTEGSGTRREWADEGCLPAGPAWPFFCKGLGSASLNP